MKAEIIKDKYNKAKDSFEKNDLDYGELMIWLDYCEDSIEISIKNSDIPHFAYLNKTETKLLIEYLQSKLEDIKE